MALTACQPVPTCGIPSESLTSASHGQVLVKSFVERMEERLLVEVIF